MDTNIICDTLDSLKETREFAEMGRLCDLPVFIMNHSKPHVLRSLETDTISILIDQALGSGASITKGTKTPFFVHFGPTQRAIHDRLEDRLLVIRSSTGNAMKSDMVRLVRYVSFLYQQIRGTGLA